MKTSHQFARELLAGPDLPFYHFDPSRAGMDDDRDTSVSEPRIERVEPDEVTEGEPNNPFLIVHGDGGEPGDEPGAFAEMVIEALLNNGDLDREDLEHARRMARERCPDKAVEFPEPGSKAWIDREVERATEKGD